MSELETVLQLPSLASLHEIMTLLLGNDIGGCMVVLLEDSTRNRIAG